MKNTNFIHDVFVRLVISIVFLTSINAIRMIDDPQSPAQIGEAAATIGTCPTFPQDNY